jgi:hypothetical protein
LCAVARAAEKSRHHAAHEERRFATTRSIVARPAAARNCARAAHYGKNDRWSRRSSAAAWQLGGAAVRQGDGVAAQRRDGEA